MDFKHKANILLVSVLAFLTIPAFFHLGSWAETKYFPVIGGLNITQYEVNEDGNPIISGTLIRDRQCTYKAMTFNRDQNGYDSPIGVQTPGRSSDRNRPVGEYEFGPWTLYTTTEVFERQGQVKLIHSCHPFYDTVTIIPMSEVLSNGQD